MLGCDWSGRYEPFCLVLIYVLIIILPVIIPHGPGAREKPRMTLLQCAFLPPLPLSLCPPLPLSPGFLDAEQTQCSLRKITRLINANKQTTALRQPQMKANLYAINKRRSSFNLPVCPARCSTPPSSPPSSASPSPPTYSSHPPLRSLSQSLLCCWAGPKCKEN